MPSKRKIHYNEVLAAILQLEIVKGVREDIRQLKPSAVKNIIVILTQNPSPFLEEWEKALPFSNITLDDTLFIARNMHYSGDCTPFDLALHKVTPEKVAERLLFSVSINFTSVKGTHPFELTNPDSVCRALAEVLRKTASQREVKVSRRGDHLILRRPHRLTEYESDDVIHFVQGGEFDLEQASLAILKEAAPVLLNLINKHARAMCESLRKLISHRNGFQMLDIFVSTYYPHPSYCAAPSSLTSFSQGEAVSPTTKTAEAQELTVAITTGVTSLLKSEIVSAATVTSSATTSLTFSSPRSSSAEATSSLPEQQTWALIYALFGFSGLSTRGEPSAEGPSSP